MDQLNDTWLHSDENKNLGKLLQWFEQPLEDNKFIMVSRCAVTPAGQASPGRPWDGVWPAGTTPGICSWANPAGKATLTDQSLCLPHRPMHLELLLREVSKDLPEAGSWLLQGKARKGREAPVPVLSNPDPAVQAPTAAASSTSNAGLSSCLSSPNHLSCFHPAAGNKQLPLPLPEFISALLTHPCGCASPSALTVPSALPDWHQQHFSVCLHSPLNFCPGAAQFCPAQHSHTERNVLFPSEKTWGHWAWNLLLYLITLQNPYRE